MTRPASHLVCGGCGAAPPDAEPYPFRCPNADGDDVDHVLERVLDTTRLRFPLDTDPRPFVRYRSLLHSHHRAIAGGMTDGGFADLVAGLDDAVAAVDGRGFAVTPFGPSAALSDDLGVEVWVKDETGNVAGSHKGRHLFGVLLHLEVAERLGLSDRRDLAVASCGNAALAAGVLARAGGRRLKVFVPVDADAGIVARLRDLGADVVACARTPGVAGDPAVARLRDAVAGGAIPFTCQGSENGLVIEGGQTLGYELVSDLAAAGEALDHLVVQVGGGALASACVQALRAAVDLGVLARLPRIHTVQTAGGHPLERAYRRVHELLPPDPAAADVAEALRRAATHRSAFMWPWEDEPRSMATGILDDETYDWRAVVAGMLATGGRPVVVDEARLAEAHALGHRAGYRVEPTGSAGLAGLLDLRATGVVRPGERVGVLFTGVDRVHRPW